MSVHLLEAKSWLTHQAEEREVSQLETELKQKEKSLSGNHCEALLKQICDIKCEITRRLNSPCLDSFLSVEKSWKLAIKVKKKPRVNIITDTV